MELLNVKKDVELFLAQSEKCRESDSRLVASMWVKFLGEEKLNKMTAAELMDLIALNAMPNPESIRRVRQKLQEKNPLYRGRNYLTRDREKEKVKEQIKQF